MPAPVSLLPFYPDNPRSQATPLSRKWGPPKIPLAPEGTLAEGGDWPDGLNRGRRQPVGWLLRAGWHNWLVWAPGREYRISPGSVGVAREALLWGLGCGKYYWRTPPARSLPPSVPSLKTWHLLPCQGCLRAAGTPIYSLTRLVRPGWGPWI